MDKYDKITNITVLQLYMFVYLFLEQHVSVLICVQIRVHSFVYTVHYVYVSASVLFCEKILRMTNKKKLKKAVLPHDAFVRKKWLLTRDA